MTPMIKGALVPGLPQLLRPETNPNYKRLALAMQELGDVWHRAGIKHLVYYSTQWISVLGHSVQMRQNLSGTHVDDNWHQLGELSFDLNNDPVLASHLVKSIRKSGHACQEIDYDHFPIDTGTIVADALLNRGRFTASILSCHVYADQVKTQELGKAVFQVITEPTAIVGITLLSTNYFTTIIDPANDRIRETSDDENNQTLLSGFTCGDSAAGLAAADKFIRTTRSDMGLKAYHFVLGALNMPPTIVGHCHAYGPIYGTGAAVVSWE